MVTRWTRKIVAFLHDPPGKALVLRSVPHTSHEQLAKALQRIALGRRKPTISPRPPTG
jgi:CRISPR-associated protein Cmr2